MCSSYKEICELIFGNWFFYGCSRWVPPLTQAIIQPAANAVQILGQNSVADFGPNSATDFGPKWPGVWSPFWLIFGDGFVHEFQSLFWPNSNSCFGQIPIPVLTKFAIGFCQYFGITYDRIWPPHMTGFWNPAPWFRGTSVIMEFAKKMVTVFENDSSWIMRFTRAEICDLPIIKFWTICDSFWQRLLTKFRNAFWRNSTAPFDEIPQRLLTKFADHFRSRIRRTRQCPQVQM